MKQFHVVSVSIGTGLLLCMLTGFVVLGAAIVIVDAHSKTAPTSIPSFKPQNGSLGEIEHQLNELKFGPVNTNATKEVKNGWLLDRIRSNRQSRVSLHQVCSSPVNSQSVCLSQSVSSVRIVDPTDCNYSYIVANPVAGQTILTQSTGFEMPKASPIHPLEESSAKDCETCTHSARNAVKTGAFICSNCRKPRVGEWHTEWKSDGTPVTFLCEHCHSIMSPEQREKAYIGYLARQSKSVGISGLLHQEMGQ